MVVGQEVTLIAAGDYDGLGRQTSATLAAAGHDRWATTTVYHGDHDDITPPSGSVSEQWHDMLGELTKVVEEPNGAAVPSSYSYDALGDLTTIWNAGTRDASYSYDWLGHRTHVDDADAGVTDTSYDADGNPTTVTHTLPGGGTQATTTSYDDFDRPLATHAGTDSSGTLLTQWAYDSATNGIGRLRSATQHATIAGTDVTSTVSTDSYDPQGDPTSVTYTLPTLTTGTPIDPPIGTSPSPSPTTNATTNTPTLRLAARDHVTAPSTILHRQSQLMSLGGMWR